jgi:AbrB family looped-hinge helix DNA binding protein
MTNLTSKGQVTIPKAVREHLGLRPGDTVEFRIVEGEVIVRPLETDLAWRAGKDVFGRHASGESNRSVDRKKLLGEKLRARRARG